MPQKIKDLSGLRFNYWTVEQLSHRKNELTWFICRCDCGTKKLVPSSNLKNGTSKSCGCLRKTLTGKRFRTHGLSRASEYKIWQKMIKRCTNPKYHRYADYGGRGIYVCKKWQSFENFYADMGPRPSAKHSIDRINNNGPYSPQNCRWANRFVQAQNKRNSRYFVYGNDRRTVPEWSRITGLSVGCIWNRVKLGWDFKKILQTPPALGGVVPAQQDTMITKKAMGRAQ